MRTFLAPGWDLQPQGSCHTHHPHHHYLCPSGQGLEPSDSYPECSSNLMKETESTCRNRSINEVKESIRQIFTGECCLKCHGVEQNPSSERYRGTDTVKALCGHGWIASQGGNVLERGLWNSFHSWAAPGRSSWWKCGRLKETWANAEIPSQVDVCRDERKCQMLHV